MRARQIVISVMVLAWVVSPALLAEDGPVEGGKVKGEVVQVRQATRLGSEGEFTEVKVRTRNQQEMWLRLGPSEEHAGEFQIGDRVRARFTGGRDGEPAMVRSIHNYRTGQRLELRDTDGSMLRQQDRRRDGTGDQLRTRQRDRIHEPGTGGCSGSGARAGGRGGGRR
jgi:hypothetical protein